MQYTQYIVQQDYSIVYVGGYSDQRVSNGLTILILLLFFRALQVMRGLITHVNEEILRVLLLYLPHELVELIHILQVLQVEGDPHRWVYRGLLTCSKVLTEVSRLLLLEVIRAHCCLNQVGIQVYQPVPYLSYHKQGFIGFPSNDTCEEGALNDLGQASQILLLWCSQSYPHQEYYGQGSFLLIAVIADYLLFIAFAQGFPTSHLGNNLVKEQRTVVHLENVQGVSINIIWVLLEQLGDDVGYLGRVVPTSRLQFILFHGQLGYVLDREHLCGVEVIEEVQDLRHLLFGLQLEMLLEDRGDVHLPSPDHTSPAGVGDFRCPVAFQQRVEPLAVRYPYDIAELIVDGSVQLWKVAQTNEFLSQQEELLVIGDNFIRGILFQVGDGTVFQGIPTDFQ